MKKLIFHILSILLFFACGEYDNIDSKPGEPINPVTNLNHTVSGTQINLTWSLPGSYPDDILQPVSIWIKISRDGQTIETRVLENAPSSFSYTSYDVSKKYRFTVKVLGNVNTDDPNFSNLRYSPGVTVEI